MPSTKLTRSVTTTGNQKTFTISVWLKRSKLGTNQFIFSAKNVGETTLYFRSQDDLQLELYDGNNYYIRTNRLFRDTSAWYHIVAIWDSTQATSSDRMKLYVNGVQETSLSAAVYPPQNYDSYVNQSGELNQIGTYAPASAPSFDGSMSHFHLIDGTAYTPSAFGQYDANGVWTIKTSPSVTYGTNGFFILKDGNSVTDQSGNSNNWSVAGGTLTNTEDCPSNVFCNFMSHTTSSYMTILNGGTTLLGNTATDSGNSLAGLGVSSGKYYFEYKMTTIDSGYAVVGMVKDTDSEFGHQNANGGGGDPAPRIYGFSASNTYNGSSSVSDVSFSAGDIIGIALDLDNGALYASQNGTYLTSGDPTSGASKTGAKITWTPDGTTLVPYTGGYNSSRVDFNFGNGYFGTTAVSSAGTNASGNGIFEYDVPTGYTALSTKGLNL